MKRTLSFFFALLLSLSFSNTAMAGGGLSSLFGGGDDEILQPDQAFHFDALVVDGNTLLARWDITKGYYLYQDKYEFTLEDANGIRLGDIVMPPGEEKDDEFFGLMQVYHYPMEVRLPLLRENLEATSLTLAVRYQGCAEAGLCYPPIDKSIQLNLPAGMAAPDESAATTKDNTQPLSEQDSLAQSLATGSGIMTILTFFGLGLLLAFTPCVFPMIPILSGIIIREGDSLTTHRAFVISIVYVLAMSVAYTFAGVMAGLFGGNLQAAFQNPWILGSFSGVFVVLALSMFGFYNLQIPAGLQGKLSMLSHKQEGHGLHGVAIMGLLSALIVGPCVAAPLMGALIYIGQTGDALLGGAALFSLSLGMGAPLILIGGSAGKLLPKAGAWMDIVKSVFGVLLLAVAIWLLERIIPAAITMVLWALMLVICAAYMGALEPLKEGTSGWHKLWKGLGLVFLIYGAMLFIGAAAGGSDTLQPLKGLAMGGGASNQDTHLTFKTIKSTDDLQREVAAASAAGKPVMLDFYADWCISCKEMEKYTFSDPGVQQTLATAVLLQADVTLNDDADKALLKQFKLLGPPSILFFGASGTECRNYRVVGFMEVDEFQPHAANALAC